MKDYYIQKELSVVEMQNEATINKVIDSFIASKPLVDFLNKTIEFEQLRKSKQSY